jgi:Ni/Co efflux regulator RcnB
MKTPLAALAVIGLLLSPAMADAGKSGKVFSSEEARVITEALGVLLGAENADKETTEADKKKDKPGKKGLPPGLAKKETLPPGLQKQVERGGTLPPGLAKRDLPASLSARLGAPAEGTERVIAGTDVVLIEKATGVVLDILRGAARGK